jgi:hypothetical protein
MEGKRVVPAAEMVAKLKAALDARVDADLIICARTDARATLSRCGARPCAGLCGGRRRRDVREAPESLEELMAILAVAAPQVVNMVVGGKTRSWIGQLRARFALVLYANVALQGAVHGMQAALRQLRDEGRLDESGPVAPFRERQRLVGKRSSTRSAPPSRKSRLAEWRAQQPCTSEHAARGPSWGTVGRQLAVAPRGGVTLAQRRSADLGQELGRRSSLLSAGVDGDVVAGSGTHDHLFSWRVVSFPRLCIQCGIWHTKLQRNILTDARHAGLHSSTVARCLECRLSVCKNYKNIAHTGPELPRICRGVDAISRRFGTSDAA